MFEMFILLTCKIKTGKIASIMSSLKTHGSWTGGIRYVYDYLLIFNTLYKVIYYALK